MATNESMVPDLSQQALNKQELAVLKATLHSLVPFIKTLTKDGVVYTKMLVPPQGGQ